MKKLLLLSFILLCSFLMAQQEGQGTMDEAIAAYEVKLDSIDKQYIRTKYLLNRGFMIGGLLDDYFEFAEDKTDNFTSIRRTKFKRIYRGLGKSDLRNNRNKMLARFDFKALRREYKQKRNTIPLGIIQARGEYLDSLQIEDHIDKMANDLPVDEEYERYFIYGAGALKKKVYSGNVKFEVVPELFHLQNPNSIRSLEIDFSDGLGFRPLDENSSFNVTYESIGEQVIAIRFKQRRRTFTCYSTIDVVTTNEEQPNRIITLGAGSNQNQQLKNGKSLNIATSRSSSSTAGGTASVFLGCDLVFDQPVIVIEGFDAMNDRDSDDLRRNYTNSSVEEVFRANGHDMVYVNFNEGGDDMNRNRRFIEDLIQRVNNDKVGNEDIIVIGESTGGYHC